MAGDAWTNGVSCNWYDHYYNLMINNMKEELDRIKKENERLRKEREWLPIESAPKDGTHIIGYWADDQFAAAEAAYDSEAEGWKIDPYGYAFGEPTHWMPLPDRPE